MKALIFAAGLGSRLRPLTDKTPKALLSVNGRPLLDYAIEKLVGAGVTEIIINVHHLHEQIIDYVKNNNYPSIRIAISDEHDLLLDTGGGLKKAAWFFDDGQPFFVYNADVLTDLNLSDMLDFHRKNNALATLAVSDRPTMRYFLFDKTMRLHGWTNLKTGEIIPGNLIANDFRRSAFSGIHVIDPKLFGLMDKEGCFSIIPEYVRLCSQHVIMGYDHTGIRWLDIGKPESFPEAEDFLREISPVI